MYIIKLPCVKGAGTKWLRDCLAGNMKKLSFCLYFIYNPSVSLRSTPPFAQGRLFWVKRAIDINKNNDKRTVLPSFLYKIYSIATKWDKNSFAYFSYKKSKLPRSEIKVLFASFSYKKRKKSSFCCFFFQEKARGILFVTFSYKKK